MSSISKRLAALEALEQAAAPAPEIVEIEHLSEDELLAVAWEGLRDAKWGYDEGAVGWPREPYWQGVCERVSPILVREQRWIVPASPEEFRLVRDALQAGTMLLEVRLDHWPIWYYFAPPAPFPDAWYNQPAFLAAKHVARALSCHCRFVGGKESPHALVTTEAVTAWIDAHLGEVDEDD